jgi:hypothetical protein
VSDRRLSDDEVDRLLRAALADDLPKELEDELRREARLAWRWRRAAEPRRGRWLDRLFSPVGWRPLLPQPVLVAAALAMLGAGALMQAAPAPADAVASLRSLQTSALTSRALARARGMECTVEIADGRGPVRRFRVDWTAPGAVRVHLDGARGPVERALSLPDARSSVLTGRMGGREDIPRDPELEPVWAYLTPSALGHRLAAPGLTVTIDAATHLPLRLGGTDQKGRRQTATCRWP